MYLLNQIGQNQSLPLYILIAVVFILIIALLRLEFRLKRFLIGKNAKDFDQSIENIKSEIKHLNIFQEIATEQFVETERKLGESIRAVETIRFNPFKGTGTGGNQSFSIALLNENDNGVILTCLHARERISLFSKPVIDGKPQYDLSEEEETVLKKAQKKLAE